MTAKMVEVYARRGPLVGRRVEIPENEVGAATAKSGWATKIEPGAELLADPSYPFDPKWKIPGYEPPADSGNGKAAASTAKTAAKDEDPAPKDTEAKTTTSTSKK